MAGLYTGWPQVGAVDTCPWRLGDALHKLLAVVPHLPESGQQ